MDEIIDGVRPKFPNSVAIGTDNVVYWTDSNTNYGLNDGIYPFMVDGTGR